MANDTLTAVPVPHHFEQFPRVTQLTGLLPKDGYLQRWLDKELLKAGQAANIHITARIKNDDLDAVYAERQRATALPN